MDKRSPDAVMADNPVRAIDILAERLPTVAPPPKTEGTEGATTSTAPEKKNVAAELTPSTQKQTGEKKPTTTAGSTSPKTTNTNSVPGVEKPVKQAQTTPVKPSDPNKETPRP
jgi:hypothetical protein